MRTASLLPLLLLAAITVGCDEQNTATAPDVPSAELGPQLNAFDEHRARIIKDIWYCGMPDYNGDILYPLPHVNIITNSKNNNAHHICKAEGVANPTGKALVWDPYDDGVPYSDEPCWIWNGEDWLITMDWKQVISASGNATLYCHYKEE
jgi:hypothetical protein